jgi:hypothetical protein
MSVRIKFTPAQIRAIRYDVEGALEDERFRFPESPEAQKAAASPLSFTTLYKTAQAGGPWTVEQLDHLKRTIIENIIDIAGEETSSSDPWERMPALGRLRAAEGMLRKIAEALGKGASA